MAPGGGLSTIFETVRSPGLAATDGDGSDPANPAFLLSYLGDNPDEVSVGFRRLDATGSLTSGFSRLKTPPLGDAALVWRKSFGEFAVAWSYVGDPAPTIQLPGRARPGGRHRGRLDLPTRVTPDGLP